MTKKPYKVIVNAKPVEAWSDIYTYRGIVELAGFKPDSDVLYTVTYSRAVPHERQGLTASGTLTRRVDPHGGADEDIVIVTDGTIFNVTVTNNG